MDDGAGGAGGDNPFQSPIAIKLAVQPPTVDHEKLSLRLPELYFEIELVKHFGFLLDVEADDRFQSEHILYSYPRPKYKYTQYIHRSGTAFVQIREPGNGFLWVNNRLLTSHLNYGPSTAKSMPSLNTVNTLQPDTLRKQFESFCTSADDLISYWNDCSGRLLLDKHALLDDLTDEAADAQLIVNRGDDGRRVAVGGRGGGVAAEEPKHSVVVPSPAAPAVPSAPAFTTVAHLESPDGKPVPLEMARRISSLESLISDDPSLSRPTSPVTKQRPNIRMYNEWPVRSAEQTRRNRSLSVNIDLDSTLTQLSAGMTGGGAKTSYPATSSNAQPSPPRIPQQHSSPTTATTATTTSDVITGTVSAAPTTMGKPPSGTASTTAIVGPPGEAKLTMDTSPFEDSPTPPGAPENWDSFQSPISTDGKLQDVGGDSSTETTGTALEIQRSDAVPIQGRQRSRSGAYSDTNESHSNMMDAVMEVDEEESFFNKVMRQRGNNAGHR